MCVEGVDVVMIFQGDQGMQHLVAAKFKVGADASAGTGLNLNTQVHTYSLAKGAEVRRDDDSMRAFYRWRVSTRGVLDGPLQQMYLHIHSSMRFAASRVAPRLRSGADLILPFKPFI